MIVISIHTAAWAVTIRQSRDGLRQDISIHTAAWAVTASPLGANSVDVISIHTAAWAVTAKEAKKRRRFMRIPWKISR